jgi:ADP-ribose pyrophosphatase YjhB (NUDIX family)
MCELSAERPNLVLVRPLALTFTIEPCAMEDIWLNWAKRIRAIASTGMHYARDQYDAERYQELYAIALQMLAHLGGVPLSRIEQLVSQTSKGYETPKVDVRGAVFSGERILLVQEISDGLWTLPGGYAEVGSSPSENVIAEVWEEARLKVVPKSLYAIRHKAKHEYPQDVRDFYKLFFICERVDDRDPAPGPEVAALGYFEQQKLPPLSTGRVLPKDVHAAFMYMRASKPNTEFD